MQKQGANPAGKTLGPTKLRRLGCVGCWLALACSPRSPATGSSNTSEAGASGAPSFEDDAGTTSWGDAGGAPGEGGASGAPVDLELAFVGTPSFGPNDNSAAPGVGVVQFETTLASSGSLEVSGGGEDWVVPLEPAATVHRKGVVGLKPDTEYQVTVRAGEGHDEIVSAPLSWHTPRLPDDFPYIELVLTEPSRMEPGMTLFDARDQHYLIVVDREGLVRWYYRTRQVTDGHLLLRNGHVIFVSRRLELIEIDWLGNTRSAWYAAASTSSFTPSSGSIPVDVQYMHHSVHEMPDGNLLTFSQEFKVIDDYPTSSTDSKAPTAATEVRGDVVVEFTREGELEKSIALFDLLDPTRVGHDSVGTTRPDWAHCNAAVYDPESDAYVVSSRHQDAVFKIDRESEGLVWILGNPTNWRAPWTRFLLAPLGALEWPYHQHAVEVVPGGVGLFDNGNYRAAAFVTPQSSTYSRAVRFRIDEEAMTVEQAFSEIPTWEGQPLYSSAMSDADRQPLTGNTLIASGALKTGGNPAYRWVQLLEVDAAGTPVFELHVRGGPDDAPGNAMTFEADRIPDIRSIESD